MIKVKNVKVYGLDDSMAASGFPMQKESELDSSKVDYDKDVKRALKLSGCNIGAGHDNFLNGIIVQFDVTAPVMWWTQFQRYHFADFVSSQSTMHKLSKMNLHAAFDDHVDPRVIDIMVELQDKYNNDQTDSNFLALMETCPKGILLTARITTNYRQLKTIYAQRKTHKLPHWRWFCHWIESLPCSNFIIGIDREWSK